MVLKYGFTEIPFRERILCLTTLSTALELEAQMNATPRPWYDLKTSYFET